MSERTDLVKAWVEKRDHDLGSAKVIFLNLPEYFDTIAFHCQQAVEKYLKSSLVFFKIEPPKSHDLVYLLEILSRHIPINDSFFKDAITLNGYGVIIRYPNEKIFLTTLEIEKAITLAEKFRIFILSSISLEN